MKIAFWNINSKKTSPRTHKRKISALIMAMLNSSEFDILILSECDSLVEEYMDIKNTDYLYIKPSHSKNDFYIRVIHKKSITITNTFELLYNDITAKKSKTRVTGNNLKTGILIYAADYSKSEDPISIIASHWVYRGVPNYADLNRKNSTELTRSARDEINKGRQVILVGDYNMLTNELKSMGSLDASMNKYYVDQDYHRFYDLSQYLYRQHSMQGSSKEIRGYGTYISNKSRHNENSCQVLDHIYVSSSFIGDQPGWCIVEDTVGTIFNTAIEELLYNGNCRLDHLPIFLEISYEP